MKDLERGRAGGPPRANRSRGVALVLLAATLAVGCDVPFEPFEENTVGPFSVFGYLDAKADTQWIRVMPVRQELLPDSAPIDAVVTLEHLGSGRVVTLRDSVSRFVDPRLGGVGYAHNFWTTEPIEPEATYRFVAARSDGAATTARVETPDLELSLQFWEIPERPGVREARFIVLHAEEWLYTDLVYTVWDASVGRGGSPVARPWGPRTTGPGRWGFGFPGTGPFDRLDLPPFVDMLRREARIAVAGSDWPYESGLSDAEIAIPGAIPTTVENGVGSLVGVATWTIPFPYCMPLEARADGSQDCTTVFDGSSASIVGKVTRDPCGPSMQLVTVRLTERYPDGGAVVWETRADWDGSYRFDGIEPGSELRLEVGGQPGGPMHIPALGPGERYVAPHVTVPGSCALGGDGPAGGA